MDIGSIPDRLKLVGDQPEATRQMVEGLRRGLSHLTLLGGDAAPARLFSIANDCPGAAPDPVLALNKISGGPVTGSSRCSSRTQFRGTLVSALSTTTL